MQVSLYAMGIEWTEPRIMKITKCDLCGKEKAITWRLRKWVDAYLVGTKQSCPFEVEKARVDLCTECWQTSTKFLKHIQSPYTLG